MAKWYQPKQVGISQKVVAPARRHITVFDGNDRYLSNFWYCHGLIGPTVEHVYQASKFIHIPQFSDDILNAPKPGDAKRMAGKNKDLVRDDWQQVSFQIMYALLQIKFDRNTNPDLFAKLQSTEGVMLVEGNHWHDNLWGSCWCSTCGSKGQNRLGHLLMAIRDQHRLPEESH